MPAAIWSKLRRKVVGFLLDCLILCAFVCFFEDFIYLFMRDTDWGRGRGKLPVGSPMWDSISGPWDHNLSRRQRLNHWATQLPLVWSFVSFSPVRTSCLLLGICGPWASSLVSPLLDYTFPFTSTRSRNSPVHPGTTWSSGWEALMMNLTHEVNGGFMLWPSCQCSHSKQVASGHLDTAGMSSGGRANF